MKEVGTIAGLLVSLLIVPMCHVLAQPIRFSEHYDLNNGAGGFLSGIHLENDTLLVVGYSLNLSTNGGYDEGHHIVIGTQGEVLYEHQLSVQQTSYKTNNVIRSSYSQAIFSAGSHCDYSAPSPGYCDFYFARLDETGDTLFTKVIARPDTSDLLLSMVETRPNKIMLIGWTYNDTTDADADILLVTVDTLGNEVNRVVYGGGGTDYIHSGLVINEDGEVIMTGYTKSFGGSANGRTWTIKTDSIGNVLWHKVYSGDANNGTGIGISRCSDGNLIISGGNNGSGNGSDGMLLKIDTEGNEIWTKRYQVPNGQGLWGVVGLDDGTIVSCGVTDDGNDQAGWLIKTDENGDTLWTRTYDPSDATDYLRNMLVMPNGDIVMVGFGRGESSTTQDGWILRVDSMGCVVENCFMVGIDDRTIDDMRFAIYPNPASDVVRFNVLDSSARSSVGMTVRVFDSAGRRVWLQTLKQVQGDASVDVSGWPDSIYLITVTDEDGNRYVERLVVQH